MSTFRFHQEEAFFEVHPIPKCLCNGCVLRDRWALTARIMLWSGVQLAGSSEEGGCLLTYLGLKDGG